MAADVPQIVADRKTLRAECRATDALLTAHRLWRQKALSYEGYLELSRKLARLMEAEKFSQKSP